MGTKGFAIKNGVLEEYTAKGGEVIIPSGVTEIRGDAFFKKGGAITSVSIPDSVVSIGLGAFDCANLQEIHVDPGNNQFASDNGLLFSKDKTMLIRCPSGNNGVYSIPAGVTKIGDRAFRGCRNLNNISIPQSVNAIGDEAFRDCSSLTEISIPESVTQIGTAAFHGCAAITSIRIPKGVSEIKTATFFGCRNLKSILIPESVTSIGNSAFAYCEKLTDIAIPENVASIGDQAFLNCKALEDRGFVIVGGIVFSYCGSGGDIAIPRGVTKIAKNAFNGCRELTTISMPEGLESIGEYAFYNCSGLTRLTIPVGVTHIGEMAFIGCYRLTHVSIPETVHEIAKDTLPENKDMRIFISDISRLPANLRMNAVLCYAEDGGEERDPRYESHCKYIKANSAKLVDQAIAYQPLLELMCRERLITPKNVECYIEAVQKTGKADLIAMMLDYQANKISVKQKENIKQRKEKEQDKIIDRTIARQGQEGITGLNIAVTGKLDTYTNRNELKAFILKNGGQLVPSLTAKVDYLIMNDPDSDSSKAKKAQDLGIEIITEHRFNEITGRTSEGGE